MHLLPNQLCCLNAETLKFRRATKPPKMGFLDCYLYHLPCAEDKFPKRTGHIWDGPIGTVPPHPRGKIMLPSQGSFTEETRRGPPEPTAVGKINLHRKGWQTLPGRMHPQALLFPRGLCTVNRTDGTILTLHCELIKLLTWTFCHRYTYYETYMNKANNPCFRSNDACKVCVCFMVLRGIFFRFLFCWNGGMCVHHRNGSQTFTILLHFRLKRARFERSDSRGRQAPKIFAKNNGENKRRSVNWPLSVRVAAHAGRVVRVAGRRVREAAPCVRSVLQLVRWVLHVQIHKHKLSFLASKQVRASLKLNRDTQKNANENISMSFHTCNHRHSWKKK